MKKSLIALLVLTHASSSMAMLKSQNFQVDGKYGGSNSGGGPSGGGGFEIPIGQPEKKGPSAEDIRQERIAEEKRDVDRLVAQATAMNMAADKAVERIDRHISKVSTRIDDFKDTSCSKLTAIGDFHEELRKGTYERYDPSKSPSLQRSYPEMILVPLAQRALLPIAETIVNIGEIGASLAGFKDLNGYPRIKTPFRDRDQGLWAKQDTSPEGLAARKMVEEGAPLYKFGKRGESFTGEDIAYYSLRNPQTFEGYGQRHAMPSQCIEGADFIEMARVRPQSDFILRRISRFEDPKTGEIFEGGEWEVVVPKGKGSTQNNGHFSK